MKYVITMTLMILLACTITMGINQDDSAEADAPASEKNAMTIKEKVGYSIGYDIGQQILPLAENFDTEELQQGLIDALKKNNPKLTKEEMTQAKNELQQAMRNPQQKPSPMIGQKAPSWEVDEWFNLGDKKTLDITDFKGKTVYLYFFQSWCPGCHSSGFPTLVKMIEKYKDDDSVAFVTIQTVFEGFKANTPEKAKQCAEKFKLSIPVGHSGINNEPSRVMRAYKTRGTPWTVIIGLDGLIKHCRFRLSVDEGSKIIDDLKK